MHTNPCNTPLPLGGYPSLDSKVSRPSAFTLIELLTVIAIIGILAAILIPVVGKVRDSARAAQSGSNTRQIALAILTYADDHNGFAPKGASGPGEDGFIQNNSWNIEIMPWIGGPGASSDATTAIQQRKAQEVLQCPAFMAQKIPSPAQLDQGYFGIGLNLALGVPENIGGANRNAQWNRIHLGRFSTLSHIVLVGSSDEMTSEGQRYQMLTSSYGNPDVVRRNGGLRHGNVATYGFGDGHVAALTPEEANLFLRPNP
jgi:prepilin-type N-terminal cleavage/methylation domain-containing protein/prepilin-type processing-associated H-X9-DG protein